MNKFTSTSLALLATTALMSASTAFAQTSSDDTGVDDDVIIVQATKRDTSLQEIPISVTVVSPDQLQDQGVASIKDLVSVTSGFNL